MFQKIIRKENKFIDWFISDKTEMGFSAIYVRRRFIEAIFLVLVASIAGYSLKVAGIRNSYPSEIAIAICIGILTMSKLRIPTVYTGNIFIGLFYFSLIYGFLTSEKEVTTYFRWFVALPMFSMLFINRNSTIFWSLVVLLSNFAFFYIQYPSTTILSDYENKLYYFSDTGIFYVIILMLIYIYYISKEFISDRLVEEQEAIKKQAEDLIIMQQELLEKNKDLQAYAYVVSHDLRAPIRGILSFSELLQITLNKKGIDDKELKELLLYVKDNAIQMEELVTDILRYAELSNDSSKEFRESDLNELLNQVLKTVPSKEKIKKLNIHQINLPPVKVLPTQTKQIFQNLISNSIKFADDTRELEIEIFEEDHDDFVLFKFKDNGIGIREDNLKAIFLPFKRFNSPSKYNGSGIGLANCAKVVKRHQGKIWAESILGEGSTIYFTLSKKIEAT